jgi:hypothetical protein
MSEEKIQLFSRILLENNAKMSREQDLKNLCESEEEYEGIIPELVKRFTSLGLSLVRTQFHGERYYVLTTPGKDDLMTPNMYATLGLLIALYNDLGADIPYSQVQDIFKEVWTDIEALIKVNYLEHTVNHERDILEITPLGKGAFKNVIKSLELKEFLNLSTEKEE